MSKVTPLADRVIIKRTVEPESITPGGIVIPDNARTTSQEGTVVAVGRGKRVGDQPKYYPVGGGDDVVERWEYEPLQVKVGDRVLFGKYAGSEISIDDVPHVIMREDELLAVIAVEGKAANV